MQKQAWLVIVGVLLTGIIGISQSREIADETDFEAAMKDVGKNFGAVRSAISGRRVSPPLFESMELLGRDSSLSRLRRFRELAAARG